MFGVCIGIYLSILLGDVAVVHQTQTNVLGKRFKK
jgi:nucleoside phosphorylase